MKPLSIVVREDAMAPLDRWLATGLSEALGRAVPRSLVRRAIVGGVVAIGGRIVRDPSLILKRGPSVFIRHFDWLPPPEAEHALRILHEDDWIIAVDKPAGLQTHESRDPHRKSLTQLVEGHVGRRIFVHHRLDAGTSGVVLFAKDRAANPSLARSFAEREVDKTYVALVARPPIDWPAVMKIDTPILISENGSVGVDREGIQGITLIRVLDRRQDRLLVEARPVTGRKHQIRVHLASVRAPIMGDRRYGGPPSDSGRMMLHAERMELTHPVSGKRLVISSPRPDEFRDPKPIVSRASGSRRLEKGPPPARPAPGVEPGAAPPPVSRSRKQKARRMPVRAEARGTRR